MKLKMRFVFDCLHPFLFGLYPLLFLAAYNKKQLEIRYIFPHILIIVSAIAILLAILSFILKNRRKASVFATLCIVSFFSYGHIRHLIENIRIWQVVGPDHILFILILVFLAGGFVYLRRTRRALSKITQLLNVISAGLFLFSAGDILLFKIRNPYRVSGAGIAAVDPLPETSSPGRYPDIYYLIFDRYPGEEVLREVFDYDNSDFIEYLRSRGFYVVDGACANYHKTAQSLASSLDMTHLLGLKDELGARYEDWQPIYDMLSSYEVLRYLKARGYLYIHLGSWWKPTSTNPYADIDYSITSLSEFGTVFYGTTILYPICYKLNIGGVFADPWLIQYERVLYKFAKLGEIPALPGPKFIFAHFAFPHPPYIFAEDGQFVPLREARKRDRLTDQLTFANKKIIELIENILANSPAPPVIIIQSDEGPFPARYAADEADYQWADATEWELKEKFRILNAIHVPDDPGDLWYESVTPVNTFRILFNHLFGEDYNLLPDRSYAVSRDRYPYDFIDLTDRLLP